MLHQPVMNKALDLAIQGCCIFGSMITFFYIKLPQKKEKPRRVWYCWQGRQDSNLQPTVLETATAHKDYIGIHLRSPVYMGFYLFTYGIIWYGKVDICVKCPKNVPLFSLHQYRTVLQFIWKVVKRMKTINVRIPQELIDKVEKELEIIKARQPGMKTTRSDVIRYIL